MHIIRDKKMLNMMKLATYSVFFVNIILCALVLLLYWKGRLTSYALILAAMLFVTGITGFFYYRHFYLLDYSVDSTGIKILSGQTVKKTLPWHSFNYVGELNRSGQYGTQGVIVCLPEPPKPEISKDGDSYSFSPKGAVWIDYTPEDAQILRPYYRGQLPPRI